MNQEPTAPEGRKTPPATVLFLGKQNDGHTARALDFCRRSFPQVVACLGQWGDPWPEAAENWSGDLIVSYLSRWVVPARLLERARWAALNFHPAPPEYPGIGCNNFALYDEAAEYGATCHHMAPRVDTGPIVAVVRFPLLAADNVESLLLRTYDHQLTLFYRIIGGLAAGRPLPASPETWPRAPYTRREFEELRRIRPEMSAAEIARRIRATDYGPWKPYLELHGRRFELKGE